MVGVSAAAPFAAPRTLADALAARAAGAVPLAGGTDLVVGHRQGRRPLPESLVSLHHVAELRGVREVISAPVISAPVISAPVISAPVISAPVISAPVISAPVISALSIGAVTTHDELLLHPLVVGSCTALADAAAIVGSVATRGTGTLGGNVMNASPAADTVAPLLCHDAVAVLRSAAAGERRVPLAELVVGPGRTTARPDELLTAVELTPGGPRSGGAYVRLEYRRQMEIAVVGAAAVVGLDEDGRIVGARVAVTAVAPTVRRVTAAEQALVGAGGEPAALAAAVTAAGVAASEAARPISDVRGSAAYRAAMTAVIVERAVTAALTRARAGAGAVPVPASDTTFGAPT